jgi:exonuclease SbcD
MVVSMRILHTSDWHLGRSFAEHRMLDQQADFVDWLVDLVRSEGIEVVVVAGDLFDRSVPPADAWDLLWSAFRRLADAGSVVVAVAGNHDSAERLGATDGLTELAGVYLRGGYRQAAAPVVLELPGGPLAVAPVPYLDPRLAPVVEQPRSEAPLPEPLPPTHESVLADALARCRAALPQGVPTLGVAHAFVTGAAPSGSERELAVGEASMVSASLFEGLGYVALGHLHSPQAVGRREDVRYSGSPLAYSFGERAAKEVVVVDLAAVAPVRIERMAVGVGRGVRTLRGALDELLAGPVDADSWVRAELTDRERPLDAARRLRDRFPWLAEVDWVGARRLIDEGGLAGPSEVRADPHEIASEFWRVCTGRPLDADESDLLAEVLGSAGPESDEVAA